MGIDSRSYDRWRLAEPEEWEHDPRCPRFADVAMDCCCAELREEDRWDEAEWQGRGADGEVL